MIDWIKIAQGVAAIVAATLATLVAWGNLPAAPRDLARAGAPMHARIAALERLNRDTRLLVTPDDYFQLIARQTSGSTKNVASAGSL